MLNILRLLLLAAIWGASFIFLRLISPALGPLATACFRVLIAGFALLAYLQVLGIRPAWREDLRHYFLIGIINSAVPFALYSYAALHIPAGLSVILNSTTPMFAALFASFWLGEALTIRKVFGLLLGMGGVSLVALKGLPVFAQSSIIAGLACLCAAVCYGMGGIYIKKFAAHLPALGIATFSQLAAGVVLLPFLTAWPVQGVVDQTVIWNLVAMALLCSGLAYILYYRLMVEVGPTRTLTVTLLMPLFGMLWGRIFLNEAITPQMLSGCALILTGTAITMTGNNP